MENVVGGIGIWNSRYEESYQQQYNNSGSTDSFNVWFKNNMICSFKRSGVDLTDRDLANLDDALTARQLWITNGKQADKTYYCSDGVGTYVV